MTEGKKQRLALRMKFWREVCEFYGGEYGYTTEMVTEHHIRLTHGHSRVDLFPKSGKYFYIDKQKWDVVVNDDIETFVQHHWSAPTK